MFSLVEHWNSSLNGLHSCNPLLRLQVVRVRVPAAGIVIRFRKRKSLKVQFVKLSCHQYVAAWVSSSLTGTEYLGPFGICWTESQIESTLFASILSCPSCRGLASTIHDYERAFHLTIGTLLHGTFYQSGLDGRLNSTSLSLSLSLPLSLSLALLRLLCKTCVSLYVSVCV